MSYAIPFSEYEESYTTAEDDFRYGFLGREVDLPRRSVENCFFTAPFYTVDGVGSNHYAGNRIIEVIRKMCIRDREIRGAVPPYKSHRMLNMPSLDADDDTSFGIQLKSNGTGGFSLKLNALIKK